MMKYAILKAGAKDIEIKEVQEVDNLKELQNAVGGYIEILPLQHIISPCPAELANVIVVMDEEGKIKGKKINIKLDYDFLVGDLAFVVSDAPRMKGLTDNQIVLLRQTIQKLI